MQFLCQKEPTACSNPWQKALLSWLFASRQPCQKECTELTWTMQTLGKAGCRSFSLREIDKQQTDGTVKNAAALLALGVLVKRRLWKENNSWPWSRLVVLNRCGLNLLWFPTSLEPVVLFCLAQGQATLGKRKVTVKNLDKRTAALTKGRSTLTKGKNLWQKDSSLDKRQGHLDKRLSKPAKGNRALAEGYSHHVS